MAYEPYDGAARDRRRAFLGYRKPKNKKRGRYRSQQPEKTYSDYKDYLASKIWSKTRRKILVRDNFLCVYCHAPAAQVHHVRYPKKMGDEDPRMLQSVCRRCHDLAHGGTPKAPIVVVFIPGELGIEALDDLIHRR